MTGVFMRPVFSQIVGFISFQLFPLHFSLSTRLYNTFLRCGTSRRFCSAIGTFPGPAILRFRSSHAFREIVIGDAIAMARIDGHVLQHSFDSSVPVTMASTRPYDDLAGCCQCHDAGPHCRVATGNSRNVLSRLR